MTNNRQNKSSGMALFPLILWFPFLCPKTLHYDSTLNKTASSKVADLPERNIDET